MIRTIGCCGLVVGGGCRGDPPGHWTLTRAGVPSVGSIKITVISSWLVMAPLARGVVAWQGRLLSGLGPGFRWWFTVGAAPTQSGIFRPIALRCSP